MKKVICVAPDKFKGTLTAAEAAEAIASVLRSGLGGVEVVAMPLADGGEGTAASIAQAKGWRVVSAGCRDAMGKPAHASFFANGDGSRAIIDSSAVIGLQMIQPGDRDVMKASSAPLGELVARVIKGGAERLTIGIGGTATSDGGAGLLQALGVRFYDGAGAEISRPICPAMLADVARADDPDGVLPFYGSRLRGLSDVAVPLLPETGGGLSVLSFAPQKGLSERDLPQMERLLTRFRDIVMPIARRPDNGVYAGAGGGLGFALGTVIGCDVELGAPCVISAAGVFDRHPSLVVTGEGSLDAQSFSGKVVGTLASECAGRGVPLAVIAGRVEPGLQLPEGIVAVKASSAPGDPIPENSRRAAEMLSGATESLLPGIIRAI